MKLIFNFKIFLRHRNRSSLDHYNHNLHRIPHHQYKHRSLHNLSGHLHWRLHGGTRKWHTHSQSFRKVLPLLHRWDPQIFSLLDYRKFLRTDLWKVFQRFWEIVITRILKIRKPDLPFKPPFIIEIIDIWITTVTISYGFVIYSVEICTIIAVTGVFLFLI